MDATSAPATAADAIERQTVRRCAWRLTPVLMLAYFCSYLDRSNISMAALTMNQQLGFSASMFGFGAGLFSVGYIVAEIPSTLILNAVGARRWIARIMLTWGLVSGLTAFIWSDWSFYGARFFLGLAEGGFYPGVVLYLTWWFPSRYRARMMALFQSASVISLFIGLPIGGLLTQLDGRLGLHGWQWLLLIEAAPSVIMSVVILRFLTDRPAEATWLQPEQRVWLSERLATERAAREAVRKFSLREAFTSGKIWMLTIAYLGQNVSQYGLILFMPMIVQGLGVSSSMVGIVSAIPFLFAFVAMLLWGWHSDATGERRWHCAIACLTCAAGMAVCIVVGPNHPVIITVALILAEMGQQSIALTFWAIPSSILTGTAAAGGIAMIQSVGQLGAWLGPWAFGLIKQGTGSNNVALLCLAAAPALSAVLVVLVGHTEGRPGPHSKPNEIAADQKTNLMRRLFSFMDSSSGGAKFGRR
jgi:MFS transporter, ACS family, tartrate transporter